MSVDLLKKAPVWRDYGALLTRHGLSPERPLAAPGPAARETVMRRAVDLLWGGVGSMGISWIGFYVKAADAEEMVLLCREPKAACSPIGLHGMCGRGWKERRPIIIADVGTLGGNYVACDPRDVSELVIPLVDESGGCDAVLDADSFDRGAFDEHDAQGMSKVLVALGLAAPGLLGVGAMRL